jgi:hypothetical protein
MEMLQHLRRDRSHWLVTKRINFDKLLEGQYVDEFLALSYRWATAEHPDPDGLQLRELQEHLRNQPLVKFVFVDFMCIPQGGERTPPEQAEFKTIMPNINFLYLACSVLILMLDQTYMERFWPQFEAWLAFMQGSQSGLASTPEGQLRCTIRCLLGTPVWYANSLKDRWLNRNAAWAHRTLSEKWVSVTNASDKEVQLFKIFHLDYMTRRSVRQRVARDATPVEIVGSGSGTPPAATLADKVAQIKALLMLDEGLQMPLAIKRANELMDMQPIGGLPTQADALLAALGTQ